MHVLASFVILSIVGAAQGMAMRPQCIRLRAFRRD
jgi:hypothetical protein